MPMTDYERAQLRLQAFKMLEGWGRTKAGAHKKLDFDEIQTYATALVEWAETPPADAAQPHMNVFATDHLSQK